MSAWTVPSSADDWAVPGYTEARELGRGASGKVVEAISDATGRRVAIKYLSPALVRDPAFMWGFRAEAQLLRSLGVPQVVQVYDYVEQPGQGAAIVMELVNGVSLHEMIVRRGPTGPEAALAVLKGSLLGLAAAHTLGIVHRDYKPENILVDTAGNSKLADFGVAVRAGKQAPAAGTPQYMAPEQWQRGAGQPGDRCLRRDRRLLRMPDRQDPVLWEAPAATGTARDRVGATRPGRRAAPGLHRAWHGQEPGGQAAKRHRVCRRA